MQTRWQEAAAARAVVAPVSLIVSAFAPVDDVRRTLTPQLRREPGTGLWLIDLGAGRNRLGGSILAQAFCGGWWRRRRMWTRRRGSRAFFAAIQELRRADLLLAYHDRSDGGLFVTLVRDGVCRPRWPRRRRWPRGWRALARGPVCRGARRRGSRCATRTSATVLDVLARHGLGALARRVAAVTAAGPDPDRLRRRRRCFDARAHGPAADLVGDCLTGCRRCGTIPRRRRKACEALLDTDDPGLVPALTFDPARIRRGLTPFTRQRRPRVAILREQGVNSQLEMAAAFRRAGFEAVDVHMTDLLAGRRSLQDLPVSPPAAGFPTATCSGRRRLGQVDPVQPAGRGTSSPRFFARGDTFTLGVCNGCQMLSVLAELIPGAGHWPRFRQNRSEQFEARLSLVEVLPSRSVLLEGMAGSRLLIATSHGEGLADVRAAATRRPATAAARWRSATSTTAAGRPRRYPANPNGSPGGIAGLMFRRRAGDDPDAAPGAGAPDGAALLASGRVGRRRALDAPVPERAAVRRLREDRLDDVANRDSGLQWRCFQLGFGLAVFRGHSLLLFGRRHGTERRRRRQYAEVTAGVARDGYRRRLPAAWHASLPARDRPARIRWKSPGRPMRPSSAQQYDRAAELV